MNLSILYAIAFITISFSLMIFAMDWSKKPRVHWYPEQQWFDIKEIPLPLEFDYSEFFITDGKNVELQRAFLIECDRFGKPYFNKYSKTYITHWTPIPAPPKK